MSPYIRQRLLDDRLQLCLDGGIESFLLQFGRNNQLGIDPVVVAILVEVLAKGSEKALLR